MIDLPNPKQVVADYVEGVLSGRIVACRPNYLAIRRYAHDLDHAKERGFYFDERIASRAVLSFPVLCKHTVGGQFANKPFILEPWQAFCTWNLFGWRRKENNLRRFRKGYVTVAAKSGKTTWFGGLALILALADIPAEQGPQIYIVSTKLDQSRILYDEAVKFSQQTDEIKSMTKVYKAPHRIEIPSCHGLIRPIALDSSMDGFNAHGIFIDELHAMREKHRDGREKLKSRTLARQQPLELIITTAGDERSLLWQEEDDYACRVVDSVITGNVIDDTYFAFIARLDHDDEPFDEANWIKANPSLGVTIPVQTIREEANRAKHDPVARNEFLRYKCNIKVSSSLRAIGPDDWMIGNRPLTIQPGAYGHGGIDLARTEDLAAVSMVFPVGDKFEFKLRCFGCRGKSNDKIDYSTEPFRTWLSQGLIDFSDGDSIDFNRIRDLILEWNEEYDIQTWTIDPAWAKQFGEDLQNNHGLTIFSFKQSHFFYNEPCTLFCKYLKDGRIAHANEPVAEWNFANLTLNTNTAGLVMPDKKNRKQKIDGAVATLMAFSECLYAQKTQVEGPLYV